MRVSPALLACFSFVAIAGLPSQAAESSETASSGAVEAKLDSASDLPAVGPAQPASHEAGAPENRLEPVVEQRLAPRPTLAQLLEGATKQQIELEPPNLEDAPPAEAPPADVEIDVPADEPDEPAPEAVPAVPDATGEPEADEPEADEPDAEPGDAAPDAAPEAAPGEPAEEEAQQETRVLVSEVDVVSESGQPLPAELIDAVYRAVGTEPGRTTTRSQLQEDINSVFGTGFFSNVRAAPEDTPLGVKVTFFVQPNPVLTRVDVRNRQVLDDETIDEIFAEQYGEILNLRDFQDSVLDLNDWYQENGYVLAQVTAAPQVSDDGVVTLIVAEGEIESIEVRYITPDGETTDEEGNPIGGKTRDFIVTREFETQPGDVFQDSQIQEDIGRAFSLGIFEDIRLSLDPGDEDPRKVKMIVNIAERETGSIGASLGFNLSGDLFGQLSYNEDNVGGNNQKFRAESQVTTGGDFLFDFSFTDPWIAGDRFRTSYTTSLFNRRATSVIFDNGPIDVTLDNGEVPRINRLGGGLSFSRPLNNGLSLSLGSQYERVTALDEDGNVSPIDQDGRLLTASDDGRDDLFTVQFGAVLDRRNNPVQPTSGSIIRLGTEQSVPIGSGTILMNKLRASYSQYVPVSFFGAENRETIAFNVQGGTILGDLPPYEAFPIGGGNSVRGFEEGAVGSGPSFVQGTVDYRFPLKSQY